MSKDINTLKFYAKEAVAYTSKGKGQNHLHLDAFLSKIPPGGAILELGCGAGHHSEHMISKGFAVTPTDGTQEIAKIAQKRLRIPVGVLLFSDLNEQNRFDGIWANACLLHIPQNDLGAVIDRIHLALKSDGYFYSTYKARQNEGRDQFRQILQLSVSGLVEKPIFYSRMEECSYSNSTRQWL